MYVSTVIYSTGVESERRAWWELKRLNMKRPAPIEDPALTISTIPTWKMTVLQRGLPSSHTSVLCDYISEHPAPPQLQYPGLHATPQLHLNERKRRDVTHGMYDYKSTIQYYDNDTRTDSKQV